MNLKHIKTFEQFKENKFIWIHGLPGSGKTSIANQLNKNNDFVILDDIGNLSQITNEINRNNNIILTSPFFENYFYVGLYDKLRAILDSLDNHIIEEIWFENNF